MARRGWRWVVAWLAAVVILLIVVAIIAAGMIHLFR
jgi:hypothetical protein